MEMEGVGGVMLVVVVVVVVVVEVEVEVVVGWGSVLKQASPGGKVMRNTPAARSEERPGTPSSSPTPQALSVTTNPGELGAEA